MSKLKLYPHQQAALEKTKDQNKVAYYLDMGLGKTFVGSEKMMQLDTNINLLICQKSKINDWIDHFTEFYELSDDIMIYDLTKWKADDWKVFDQDPQFKEDSHGKLKYVLVINYELAFRRKLSELRNFTLILDESSMVQNETAKRTKFILNKLHPINTILLSGTPTSGKYENLYSQIKMLGWNISKDLYWKQYIDYEWVENGKFFRCQVNGYKNVDRLKQKLRDHGAVFMKSEEVFDLPSQNFNKIWIPSTKEYKKFIKHKIISIEDDTGNLIQLIGDTTLNHMLYSRMLCGQYCRDKFNAFEDLLNSTEDRLIVFYNFTNELDRLSDICKNYKRPISIVNGKTKDLNEYEQHDNSITFVQYQAGAMGLNLQKANKIIYYTLPLSSELFEQSKKRIHRIGQEKPCFYYYLMCKNTIEEKILKTLEIRRDYTDELFKEEIR